MKRNGRPKKAVTQERHIGFFVTHRQFAIISKKISQAGVNISDYMRQAALKAEIRPRWTDNERRLFKDAVSMSNELHFVAEVARKEGAAAAQQAFAGLRDRFDALIKRMSGDGERSRLPADEA